MHFTNLQRVRWRHNHVTGSSKTNVGIYYSKINFQRSIFVYQHSNWRPPILITGHNQNPVSIGSTNSTGSTKYRTLNHASINQQFETKCILVENRRQNLWVINFDFLLKNMPITTNKNYWSCAFFQNLDQSIPDSLLRDVNKEIQYLKMDSRFYRWSWYNCAFELSQTSFRDPWQVNLNIVHYQKKICMNEFNN